MNILETIKQQKLIEVALRKQLQSVSDLEKKIAFKQQPASIRAALSKACSSGIIAEFKRKSPSKGAINTSADVENVARAYVQAGASALSILTDEVFFGALSDDFYRARNAVNAPILRKDFIVDEYQIVETKSMGADVLLLIAKLLSPAEIRQFTNTAHQLGLEVLLEVHTAEEISDNAMTQPDLIGINNRNLNSFEVDIENSMNLARMLPDSILKVAESGLESAETIKNLRNSGFTGFLMGEYFMKNSNPAGACASLIKKLQS